jgi:predicted membrane metal-binding protein
MRYKTEREFALLFAAVATLVAFWPLWPIHAPKPAWLLVALLFLVTGLALPRLLTPVHRLWMKVGAGLGWVNSRIILGVVFFVLVTPIGLGMRLLGKDPLRMRSGRTGNSYWIRRDHSLSPQSFRNQY